MSTDVTMQELELETAELLPSRETLVLLQLRIPAAASGPQRHPGLRSRSSVFGNGIAQQGYRNAVGIARLLAVPTRAAACCAVCLRGVRGRWEGRPWVPGRPSRYGFPSPLGRPVERPR